MRCVATPILRELHELAGSSSIRRYRRQPLNPRPLQTFSACHAATLELAAALWRAQTLYRSGQWRDDEAARIDLTESLAVALCARHRLRVAGRDWLRALALAKANSIVAVGAERFSSWTAAALEICSRAVDIVSASVLAGVPDGWPDLNDWARRTATQFVAQGAFVADFKRRKWDSIAADPAALYEAAKIERDLLDPAAVSAPPQSGDLAQAADQVGRVADLLPALAATATVDAAPATNAEPGPDGPLPQSGFRLHGQELDHLTTQELAILTAMHKGDGRCNLADLTRKVVSQRAGDPGGAVTQAIKRLNRKLVAVGATLRTEKGFVLLVCLDDGGQIWGQK